MSRRDEGRPRDGERPRDGRWDGRRRDGDDGERARDDRPTPGGPAAADDRYAGVDTEAGLLVYDTRNEAAWIESDAAFELTETR